MTLKLNNLDVFCIIGDRDDERTHEQHLSVDLDMLVSNRVAKTDQLSDAVDYVELANNIRAALIGAKCRMIERAAKVAAEVCLRNDRVKQVVATVTKSGSVSGLASASAIWREARNEGMGSKGQ